MVRLPIAVQTTSSVTEGWGHLGSGSGYGARLTSFRVMNATPTGLPFIEQEREVPEIPPEAINPPAGAQSSVRV
jgi:hypothetical protein